MGFRSSVGAPLTVDGRLWSVLAVASRSEQQPLPRDTEQRLAEFADLFATAIANSEAHEQLAQLADEQAALRRVATLVAADAPPAEVFDAVSAEVAALIGADGSALTRYEADGTVTAVSGWTIEGEYRYVGIRYELEGTVSGLIFETGRAGRIENYAEGPGEASEAAREMGWRSSVGAPITVEGRLWGVLAVISKSETPLPPETEQRLAEFAELSATAIANSEAHEQLAQLRRVATLVAGGATRHRVFDAVRHEVGVRGLRGGSPRAHARVHAREACATMSAVMKNPRCAAQLRNGQRCRMVIENDGAEFCPYHLKLVDEHGADTLKKGALPKRRTLRVVAEPEPAVAEGVAMNATRVGADPATVRPRLAAAAAENLEQLQASLLEAAGSAVKPVWLTVECSGCGERSRIEAPVPDVRARVAAIELLLREGLGRPATAEEVRSPRLPRDVAAVREMDWGEMEALFAATYVNEIVVAQRSGGKALLRDKLAALSEGERRVLRETLLDLELA